MDATKSLFPSAFDVAAPKGAENWQSLYPYYTSFLPQQRAEDDQKFWFCDSQHYPTPFKPFDVIMLDFSIKCLGAYNSRIWKVPPANGVDYRILNGYIYFSPVDVAPEDIADRIPHFMERAGYYFANWDDLLANWKTKVLAAIKDMDALEFDALPDIEIIETVTGGIGLDSSNKLFVAYDEAIRLCHVIWQHHFEFLNLGYAAYLDFFTFVKGQFPSIPDQAIAKMVQGVDSDLFRPDDELKKLAQLAVRLGCADALKSGTVDESLAAVADAPGGPDWLAAWEAAKDPWFNYTSGNGFYSTDKYWIDHLDIPMGYLRDYIPRVEAGHDIMRPTAKLLAERDRITGEYRDMMDDDAQVAFDEKLGLARTVFPYVEDHNFYIEHWAMGRFWKQMHKLSRLLQSVGFWNEPDGMFYLSRNEVRDVLWDYAQAWAIGTVTHGKDIWPAEVARRREIHATLSGVPPLPALNNPPKIITEPFTIMLWGITSEAVDRWARSAEEGSAIKGMAGSPGIAEGIARVLRSPDELPDLQQGEILVTPVTAPSWAPVFGKIGAVVTDIGGMMSHAAIVCREYGLPAVTGTGSASSRITTGMRIRVDGSAGTVEILD